MWRRASPTHHVNVSTMQSLTFSFDSLLRDAHGLVQSAVDGVLQAVAPLLPPSGSPPPVWHVKHQRQHTAPMQLNDLCTKMYKEGYTHACLYDGKDYPDWANNTDKICRMLDQPGPKPYPCLQFTKIVKNYNEPGAMGLSWENKLAWEGGWDGMDPYETFDICFAKFHKDSVISPKDDSFRQYVRPSLIRSQAWIAWKDMAQDKIHGVNVEHTDEGHWTSNGFDVPTIAVWDTRCMYDVKAFTNAGNWQYHVEAPTPTVVAALLEPGSSTEATQDLPEESARKKRRMT